MIQDFKEKKTFPKVSYVN